jgi:hypothetical protein
MQFYVGVSCMPVGCILCYVFYEVNAEILYFIENTRDFLISVITRKEIIVKREHLP